MEFEVKMTSNILLSYLFRQNYRSFAGLLTIGLGIMMIALFIYNGNAIALLAGAIVLFYPPWSLFTKSKKQMLLNPAFKNPLKYRIDDQGIQVSQGDDVVFVLWEQLFRVIATKKSILI
ncbi:MAG: YcxB family protein, partial [Lachnospiraceae bacterium]|nr:YcxB family protein [Lachnospiraceae bacterium]